jgi:type VI secretion system protein ImpH
VSADAPRSAEAPAGPPADAAPARTAAGDARAVTRAPFDAAARLSHALASDPTGFGAFQAVRLLSRLHPDRAPVGGWADPASEIVRFSVPPSLAFPTAEIATLSPPGDGRAPFQMAVNFFGLTGPQGVLPHVYTQHAAAQARARDAGMRDFLDLFHHRSLSLFYRAWVRPRPALAHEAGGDDDWLLAHLLDLAGMGTRGLRGRLGVSDAAVGYYAGLFSSTSRPADGLARLVGDYFDVPAEVEQFVGEWRSVAGGAQCALGADDESAQLGMGVVGDAAWDAQARVRLRLGPLRRAQFDAFLPGGGAHDALRALTRLYADDQVGVDAQLVLDRADVAPVLLGALGHRDDAPRGPAPPASAPGAVALGAPLGRGTWLVSRPLARDPDETTLALC